MKNAFLLLLLLRLGLPGLTQSVQPVDYQFNRLSIKNGLPEDVITATLQDNQGYIWVGTQGGLVRYDGYNVKVYLFDQEDPNHAAVLSLFQDRSGDLWVGTWLSGIFRYNRKTDHFDPCARDAKNLNTFGSGIIGAIQDDGAGNIWTIVSGLDGKNSVTLFDQKKNKLTHFSRFETGNHYVNASEYYCLLSDSKGRIWIGSNNGIYEYALGGDHLIPHFASSDSSKQLRFDQLTEDPVTPGTIWMNVWDPPRVKGQGVRLYNTDDNSFKTYQHQPGDSTSLANDSIFAIQKDSKGNIWFGTFVGLSTFHPISKSFNNYIIGDKNVTGWEKAIFILAEGKSGNYWCGNANRIFIFNKTSKTFTQYRPNEKNPDDLQVNTYENLFVDRAGTPWVETAFQGLGWLNRKRSAFTLYKNSPGQSHYFPGGGFTSFVEDKDGTFWIWSSNGLYHWYTASDSFATTKQRMDQGEKQAWHFSSVTMDRQGTIWCNSFGKGLLNYNPKTQKIRTFRYDKKDSNSISSDYVTIVLEDHLGILWIGTFGGGICSFDPKTNKFRRYPYNQNQLNNSNGALDDNFAFYIYEDKQGTIWAGTNLGGLNKFNREKGIFTSYVNKPPGFMTIASIFEDGHGNLWVGTHVGGLFLFDRKTNVAKKFGEKDGLLYNGTLGINADNHDNLWVASRRGISILKNQTLNFSHLDITNGLPEEAENNLNFFKTSDGRMIMPCNNGFIVFDPEQLKPDTTLPIVHIESVEISRPLIRGNRQTDSVIYTYGKDKINLRYNENRITFDYIGLQYQNATLNQYAYQLDGYDKQWIEAGTQRKVTYTNLSPGTYTFHVKAANSDGVWNPEEQTMIVIIAPPWWLTWWAYVLYALLAAAAIWAFVDYRAKSLKRENVVLEEKVSLRTSQLKQSIDDLKSTQTQLIQSEKMASLGELTAGIAHEIQNPLNFVNNFSDVNTELLSEMKQEMGKGNYEDADTIANNIIENEEKINHHGKRADAIVKSMLMHSRNSSSAKELTDLNNLTEEYLRLAYHGLRAKDNGFNATIQTDLDKTIGKVNIMPQEIGRVLLNLINNAFYAVAEKKKQALNGYEPTVSLTTKKMGDKVEIRVGDNGNGIPKKIADKIFQPFFTTKPAGQGTGLGLSLSYDIVRAHGGEIRMKTNEGEGSEFTLVLPENI